MALGQNIQPQNGVAPFSKTFGKRRLSLLGPRIVRLEFSESEQFEDRQTLTVQSRAVQPVTVQESAQGDDLVISTGEITVVVGPSDKPWSAENVRVTFTATGTPVTWTPGITDSQNLGGTLRTLDHCDGLIYKSDGPDGPDHFQQIPPGLLSRSGWSVHDDSTSIPLAVDPSYSGEWVAARTDSGTQDLYLFCYGLDYKGLLKDAAKIFGTQPLPPRYALGYWWSRYWAYTDKELEELILDCDEQGIPLDVLVIDMDWHRQGWTGFSWDKSYFPDPVEFLTWARSRKLHVSMNLHPADGVAPHEDCFQDVAKQLGMSTELNQTIPFDCTDRKFMEAYFHGVLGPYEKQGVEFWWMDWQQGQTCALKGLDPLPWINQLHWEHLRRTYPDRRPLSFSRWGGMGSGRYPVGFSGDTYATWRSLALLPHFTATANNVLYGYWSHDLGGHQHSQTSGELYTRWLQFGIYSPVVRTHATKQTTNDRKFWEYGEPFSRIMKNLIRRRYELVPYIYTEARACYETGISICHPMYLEHPETPEAYQQPQQYYFGSRLIVAPITKPIRELDQQQEQSIWLPEGDWYDHETGAVLTGGKSYERSYLLHENPTFSRTGTVLAGVCGAKNLATESLKHLLLELTPGGSGEYNLYEDDGVSLEYQASKGARIACSQKREQNRVVVQVKLQEGSYRGFEPKRRLTVRLLTSLPPQKVTIGNRALERQYRPTGECWWYDGASHTAVIEIGEADLVKGCTIEVTHPAGIDPAVVFGMKGTYSRLYKAFEVARVLALPWERQIAEAAQTGNRIARNPTTIAEELGALRGRIDHLIAQEEEVRAVVRKSTYLQGKKVAALGSAAAILRSIGH